MLCSHTPWAGAANIKNGITIDLSSLNQVLVAEDKSTVTVGPGNSWHRVYNEVVPQGIVVGGGRVAIVGVGGLVLGGKQPCYISAITRLRCTDCFILGGVSFFSPRIGFVCDTVKRFEVRSSRSNARHPYISNCDARSCLHQARL